MVNRSVMDKTDEMDTLKGNVILALSIPSFGHVKEVQPDLPEVTGKVERSLGRCMVLTCKLSYFHLRLSAKSSKNVGKLVVANLVIIV